MKLISVIVVTYNSSQIVFPCLQSIPKQVGEVPVEVIVIDNDSQDHTADLIRQEFPEINVVVSQQNSGFGAGNNLGFKHSSGDYIILVNPDLRLSETALNTMITYLEGHPEVGIVGPQMLDETGRLTITAYPTYTLFRIMSNYLGFWLLFPRLAYGPYLEKVRHNERPFDVAWLQGACLALSRQLYEKLGGFDEDYFLFVEDTDLCERTHQLGLRVQYLPAATVIHHGSTTVARYSLIRVRSYHQSPIHYFRKRHRMAMVLLLKIGFIFEISLKLVGRSALYLVQPKVNTKEHIQAEWMVLKELLFY